MTFEHLSESDGRQVPEMGERRREDSELVEVPGSDRTPEVREVPRGDADPVVREANRKRKLIIDGLEIGGILPPRLPVPGLDPTEYIQ